MRPHPRGIADHKVEAFRLVHPERVADPHIPPGRFAPETSREMISRGLRTTVIAFDAGQRCDDLCAAGMFRVFQNLASRFKKNALATAHIEDSAPTLEGKAR